jgi:polysaccharide deacetylase family protein (PEP-CTERM system associated)
MIKHCFSIDVEGFSEGLAESLPPGSKVVETMDEKSELERNIAEILEFLSEWGVKATFFCLGVIAERQPGLIKRIADAGHEIGSHSYRHLRLYNLDKATAKEEIHRSRKALQDASGQPVIGFRAPDFSISRDTFDLLDCILNAGYLYDSSIYPISLHDVYGIGGAQRAIHKIKDGLIEYPPSTWKIFSQILPALGGGYFRLYPLFLTKRILRSLESDGVSAMMYIHPYELGSVRSRVEGLSLTRHFRHFVNIGKCRARCGSLFQEFKFGTAREALIEGGFLDAGSSIQD